MDDALLCELRDRDTHLRVAMDASQVVAYQWDIVNDRVTRMRSSHEVGDTLENAGTFESVVAKVWPEDQARFRADIAAALASDDGLYRTECRYQGKDGEVRWVSETGRVLRGPDGKPARMVGITFDITDRKHAENALREAEAMLREQNERKDEFLAMLAHELRNPLAPIRNAVEILRMKPAENIATSARDVIDRQVGHLVRLVDDLLDVSRVSSGKILLQKVSLDFRDVVNHALDVSRPFIETRRHRLDVSMPGNPVRMHGDFTRLAQVLSNLLNNAAKYTEPGGLLTLGVKAEDAEVAVFVRDNGRGLDPSHLRQVFDLFYQVERDLDRSEGGMGIGLSLVRSLVELHGGTVAAHSAGRQQGTTFVVRLPVAEAARIAAPDGRSSLASRPRGRLRILVVDDLRDAAETMAQLLRLEGHEVLTAFDGRAAVDTALSERPDLVLLDVGLPILNGYQACRAMREGGLTDTTIAALTGYGQAEDRRLSQVAGFDAHLVKPVDPAQVEALVAKRLERYNGP
jgi:signal transduction histidine kinase/ActR/RegA family two-component response regulator